jgi:hypothetical protein
MSFNVLSVRSYGEGDDGALYPLLSDLSAPGPIALDGYDGGDVKNFVATAVQVLEVGKTPPTLIRLRQVKIDVYLTDGRLALACEKYDKGGGWVGFGGAGALVAVTANAVSKARAASRSRGKVLVGHIRYSWVKAVGATSKTGFLSEEAIRVEYAEKCGGVTVRKLLQLTLPRNTDATLVAQELARRAATYRLANGTQLADEARAKFAALQQAEPLQPPSGKFAFYQMPTFFFVNAATAFPKPPMSDDSRPVVPSAETPQAVTLSAEVSATDEPPVAPAVQATAPLLAPAAGPVFCTRCGTRSVEGDKFCEQCGTALKLPAGT